MSLTSALEKLASYRAHNSRASQNVFEQGLTVIKQGQTKNLGEEGANVAILWTTANG